MNSCPDGIHLSFTSGPKSQEICIVLEMPRAAFIAALEDHPEAESGFHTRVNDPRRQRPAWSVRRFRHLPKSPSRCLRSGGRLVGGSDCWFSVRYLERPGGRGRATGDVVGEAFGLRFGGDMTFAEDPSSKLVRLVLSIRKEEEEAKGRICDAIMLLSHLVRQNTLFSLWISS